MVVADRAGQRLAAVTAPARPASTPDALARRRRRRRKAPHHLLAAPQRRAAGRHRAGDHRSRTPRAARRPHDGLSARRRAGRALKALTGAEVAFAYDGSVRASSLPIGHRRRRGAVDARRASTCRCWRSATRTTRRWCGRWQRRRSQRRAATPPRAVVLRSRTARMRTLATIRTALAGIALATIALAAVLSYAIARTVTKPLATITAHMREVAATGDLTRKVALPATAWNDEDATVMAATFNALTESVAASQRDAAQRERLSALGRLSTVIAHEIRNPLMIIKGALRPLLRAEGSADDRRDAAARHQRRGRPVEPRRQRGARLRPADPLRAGRRRRQRRLPVGARRRSSPPRRLRTSPWRSIPTARRSSPTPSGSAPCSSTC